MVECVMMIEIKFLLMSVYTLCKVQSTFKNLQNMDKIRVVL